jgi:mono/diheme cytochrome c family protein
MRSTKLNTLLAAGVFVLAVTGITSAVSIGNARAEDTTISAAPIPEAAAKAIAEGKYLATANGCAACHTDNAVLGGNQTGQELQGNVVGGWNAPSLANDATGIGTWSVADITTYLKTGHNAYADATGPMADVIAQSSSHLDAKDLTDIGLYLKSVHGAGAPRPAPIPASDPVMVEGAHIYGDECSACHTDGGTGAPRIFPALKASPIVQATIPDTLIRVVLDGAQSVATPEAPTASAMPSFSGQLDNAQVAAVLTYIRNSWGNSAPAVTADDVAKQHKAVAAN